MLETVCRSLSDSNQVVRSAGLFALGQFSEYLQVRTNVFAMFYVCEALEDLQQVSVYSFHWYVY